MNAFVSAAKWRALADRMRRLGIGEGELVERFVLGSGRGGQKLNKTSSCVVLRHSPSGIVVKCQQTRSRELNRYYARSELCERIQGRLDAEKTERAQRAARIRRQKQRRSRRQKERMLQEKKRRAQKKRLRGPIRVEEGGQGA
ncbi:MAG: peptide chain release factor-like protein [Kiritimatiellae bacterium]|nr:peptide chain release factor-like protein [Kiritimatiellia bacterium]